MQLLLETKGDLERRPKVNKLNYQVARRFNIGEYLITDMFTVYLFLMTPFLTAMHYFDSILCIMLKSLEHSEMPENEHLGKNFLQSSQHTPRELLCKN